MKRSFVGVAAAALFVSLGAACSLMSPSHDDLSGGRLPYSEPHGDASSDLSVGNDAEGEETGKGDVRSDAEASIDGDASHDGDAFPDGDAAKDGDASQDADAHLDSDVFNPCEAGHKQCGSNCVTVEDPHFGCAALGCSPCALAHADAGCTNFACAVTSCTTGWANCDNQSTGGCEINLSSDPANCGSCGKPCTTLPHMTASCADASCGAAVCMDGYENCNSNTADGCETNVAEDPLNCGSCLHACPPAPNSTATCANSVCGIECFAGTDNCNNDVSDGCEQKTEEDPMNCGSCGHVCSYQHATGLCSNGVCALGACGNLWGNCDGADSNGCEKSLSDDKKNCGSCGHFCGGGAQCVNGVCQ